MKLIMVCLIAIGLLVAHNANTRESKEYFLDRAGDKIFVKEIGTGPALVFVHGGPGDNHMNFMPYAASLAQDFRVILYDQNDAGKSKSAKPGAHTADREVETLEFLRKELGLEKLSIVAHSWGTILAQFYALKYPQNVERLLLMASIGTSFSNYMQFAQNLQQKFTPEDIQRMQQAAQKPDFTPKDHLEIYLPYYFHDPKNIAKMSATEINFGVNREIIGDISQRFNFTAKGESFSFPIMVLQGASDLLTINDLKPVFSNYPNVQFTEADKSGHWPFVEQPELTTSVIKKFFK